MNRLSGLSSLFFKEKPMSYFGTHIVVVVVFFTVKLLFTFMEPRITALLMPISNIHRMV